MADVQPLRGIRYVQEQVGDLSQVITPPFDVISPEAQERYYERSPYNIIRLELGKEYPDDNTLNNRYTRAAKTFAEWRFQNILRQEATPCYYMYQQIFTYNGQSYTRTSLLARVRLEPWSAKVVLPHERTHAKAKDDRLKLMRACSANFSPIMSMYEDPQGRMRKLLSSFAANAEIQVSDEIQERHLLQPITNQEQITQIADFFSERQLYIADGHHRYETALNYRNEILEQKKTLHPDDGANFVMMALIDVDDPGFLVLPTHRILFGLSPEVLANVSSESLSQYFTVRTLDESSTTSAFVEELARAGEHQPSMLLNIQGKNWLLSVNEQGRKRMEQSGQSPSLYDLDVALAQTLILESLLGISAEDMTAGKYVRFTIDPEQALQEVQAGKAQGALLLNSTKLRQICDVAQADAVMPQKSTYIYPKLITGLVLNPLW